jgi:gliding motility-associatede transport system auxiliary component
MHRKIGILVGAGAFLVVVAAVLSAARGTAGWSTAVLAAAGAVWTVAVLASWRDITRTLLRRSARYGMNAVLLSFLVLVILLLVGFLGGRHSWRHDASATQEFTLSEKTLNVLQGIHERIHIYAYYERDQREAVHDLLVEYARRNRGLEVHMEDLNKNPELAERFGVTELGTLVFEAPGKIVRLSTFGEEDITNALIRASRPGAKKIYFLTGHGEKSLTEKGISGYTVAAEALQRENYAPLELSLIDKADVPQDCDVLVVAGAKSGLLQQEVDAIRRYMQHSGRLLCLFDPPFLSNLEGYMAAWGIQVGEDRVVDPSPAGQLVGRGAGTPLVQRFGAHPITKQFREPCYFQSVRSVRKLPLYQGNAETAELLFSGPQSWAEKNLSSSQVSFDADDLPGPVSLGMAARLKMEGLAPELDPAVERIPGDEKVRGHALEESGRAAGSEARVVAFGDSDFSSNQSFNDMGNGNLFMNTIAWLTEDEELIALRPKNAVFRSVSLTLAQVRVLNLVSIGVLPGLVGVCGLAVTLRRRARG